MIYQIEIWKDVEEFKGTIQASTLGEIRYKSNIWISGKKNNIIRYRNPTIKKKLNKDLYYEVSFFHNGKQYWRTVHTLCCRTFLPNPENKPQVNHKDLNKLNNWIGNFEWNTCLENNQHSRANQEYNMYKAFGTLSSKAKLTEDQAKEIKSSSLSCRKLAAQFNIHHSIVQGIKSGKRWAHIKL